MAFEKTLLPVLAQALTSDGTANGEAPLAKPYLFKVFQIVIIQSNTEPAIRLQVKRVNSANIILGPIDNNRKTISDLTVYDVADAASVSAEEQQRPLVPRDTPDKLTDEFDNTEHEEEPTVAKRVAIVGPDGVLVDTVDDGGTRKLQVNATVNVPGTTPPATPTIANVAIATVNTEVSHALPANTVRFFLRVRTAAKVQLAYTVAQSGTIFITIPRGANFFEGDISTASLTLYFQADVAPNTMEIVSWA